jgi:hypothetical protein
MKDNGEWMNFMDRVKCIMMIIYPFKGNMIILISATLATIGLPMREN